MQMQPSAHNARNFSQCDSMLIGDEAGANTYPYIQVGPVFNAESSFLCHYIPLVHLFVTPLSMYLSLDLR